MGDVEDGVKVECTCLTGQHYCIDALMDRYHQIYVKKKGKLNMERGMNEQGWRRLAASVWLDSECVLGGYSFTMYMVHMVYMAGLFWCVDFKVDSWNDVEQRHTLFPFLSLLSPVPSFMITI
jgi:hypothetical protein